MYILFKSINKFVLGLALLVTSQNLMAQNYNPKYKLAPRDMTVAEFLKHNSLIVLTHDLNLDVETDYSLNAFFKNVIPGKKAIYYELNFVMNFNYEFSDAEDPAIADAATSKSEKDAINRKYNYEILPRNTKFIIGNCNGDVSGMGTILCRLSGVDEKKFDKLISMYIVSTDYVREMTIAEFRKYFPKSFEFYIEDTK